MAGELVRLDTGLADGTPVSIWTFPESGMETNFILNASGRGSGATRAPDLHLRPPRRVPPRRRPSSAGARSGPTAQEVLAADEYFRHGIDLAPGETVVDIGANIGAARGWRRGWDGCGAGAQPHVSSAWRSQKRLGALTLCRA
jgi:hypothetical protein